MRDAATYYLPCRGISTFRTRRLRLGLLQDVVLLRLRRGQHPVCQLAVTATLIRVKGGRIKRLHDACPDEPDRPQLSGRTGITKALRGVVGTAAPGSARVGAAQCQAALALGSGWNWCDRTGGISASSDELSLRPACLATRTCDVLAPQLGCTRRTGLRQH